MAQSRHLLTDIRLELRHNELRPVYTIAGDRHRVPDRAGLYSDIATVSGSENLAQAIFLRLLTPRGELAGLGHPDYGSRLHELIGRENTETTRNLVRLYILQGLQQEPRISEIQKVTVLPDPNQRDAATVEVVVLPSGETESVTIGPFTLEFES